MPKLSVCIEMFWPDDPFDQRIRNVYAAGYPAFEFWNSSTKEMNGLLTAQQETGLACAGLVSEPGFALTGHRPVQDHLDGLVASAAAARALGCSTLIVTAGNVVAGESYAITRGRVLRKLRAMAAVAADEGMTLCLEPLNPFDDHPGYWLTTMAEAADLVEEIGAPSLRILYDIYHQQITEGNLIVNLGRYLPLIGHIHVAQVPGRFELVGGEIDYATIFREIDAAGYTGYVGLEFRSRINAMAALAQAKTLLPTSA